MTLIDRSFREKIVLVGVTLNGIHIDEVEESLNELSLLVDTAGADVVATMIQRRDRPDPATFIGKGKIEELAQICLSFDADTVVFDEVLSPAQQRNLEKLLGRTAIDRTAVILDIFAQNARTPSGVMQVELALLSYRLPRLRGRGVTMSQQGGGIGTRGPGETKLEVDRRRLLEKMRKLERDIKELKKVRNTQRRSRNKRNTLKVSLVGYTNAGKSSLLNSLTGSDVLVENRLFATLDPRARSFKLNNGMTIVIADTVGFIKKLPHELVESFRSTLEEVCDSDLLVHVVDGLSSDASSQIEAVRDVLDDIGASHIPEVMAINKYDVAEQECKVLFSHYENSTVISAKTGYGLDQLIGRIADRLSINSTTNIYNVPLAHAKFRAKVYAIGDVLGEVIIENLDGVSHFEIKVRLTLENESRLSEMINEINEFNEIDEISFERI